MSAYSAPTGNVAGIVNTCRLLAFIEGICANACYAVGDCYARKPTATREGLVADACHAVADCHARKPSAIREG